MKFNESKFIRHVLRGKKSKVPACLKELNQTFIVEYLGGLKHFVISSSHPSYSKRSALFVVQTHDWDAESYLGCERLSIKEASHIEARSLIIGHARCLVAKTAQDWLMKYSALNDTDALTVVTQILSEREISLHGLDEDFFLRQNTFSLKKESPPQSKHKRIRKSKVNLHKVSPELSNIET